VADYTRTRYLEYEAAGTLEPEWTDINSGPSTRFKKLLRQEIITKIDE